MPPRPSGQYCFYSDWHLIRVNAVSLERIYGVYIYNACDGDRQVFPTAADPRRLSCNNDDNLYAQGKFSICPLFPPGHVPAGLPPGRACNAETIASQALLADLQPKTYDPRQQTAVTGTMSFAADFTNRLADGTCLASIDWQDRAWTMRWSDGAVDQQAGTGRHGTTASHTIAADPTATTQVRSADITAIAHLHVSGQAVDFDAAGNPVVVSRAADVDISNKASATGVGSTSVSYTPPALRVAAIAAAQSGDGSIPALDPQAAARTHADAIRGRLLNLYPRALVVSPGVELVDGVAVGQAATTTTGWTYTGQVTDAPSTQQTSAGASGGPATAIGLQWNHAERINARGMPLDESVPMVVTAQSVYPDGHVEIQTVSGSIAVTIYYVGLDFRG